MTRYKDYLICILLFIICFFLILDNTSRNLINIGLFFLIVIFYFLNYELISYLLILTILFVFPQSDRYHLIPVIYHDTSIMILLAMSLIMIFKKFIKHNVYNKYWFIFILLIIIQTLRGIYLGHDSYYIKDEVVKYLNYPIGFFFVKSIIDKINLKKFIRLNIYAFLILGLIICLQMFYYYFFVTIGNRVLTRQTNLLLISLMTSMALLLFYKKLSFKEKAFLITVSVLYILSIIIFMQRSLWIAVAISLLSLSLIFILKSDNKKKSIFVIITILLIVISVSLLILNRYNLNKNILSKRVEVIENQDIKELSVFIRLLSYVEIIKKLEGKWIQGLAIGDEIKTTYLNRSVINIVDNSVLIILWKFGLFGILLFGLIFFHFFKQLFQLIKSDRNDIITIFSIIITTSIIGQIINGFACVIMILYHYNFIWAMFIAYADRANELGKIQFGKQNT